MADGPCPQCGAMVDDDFRLVAEQRERRLREALEQIIRRTIFENADPEVSLSHIADDAQAALADPAPEEGE